VLLVVDALATSSVRRLCHTIQITDTGISPGAGIGNHRFPVNQETMGIPVIAIGVPTVVDANTIVINTMEEFLQKEGLAEQDIDTFLRDISKQSIQDLFVTPKDIEMQIREIGKLIAGGIDQFQSGME
jgi:spore protease